MKRGNLESRLNELEARYGPRTKPVPAIFIGIQDSGLPDSEEQALQPEYSDVTTVGYRLGTGHLISREKGESVAALQRRAKKLHPDVIIFMTAYANEIGDGKAREGSA